MLREIPQQEIENNDDYARWQFETQRAEWESEQAEEQPHPCLHLTARLSSHLAHHGYAKRLLRLAACRVCGFVLGSEIE